MTQHKRLVCLVTSAVIVLLTESLLQADDQAVSPTLTKLVPSSVDLFVSLQAGRHLTLGPEAKELNELARLHPVVPLWWTNDLPNKLGVRRSNIDRVTFIYSAEHGSVLIISTHNAYDRTTLLSTITPEPRKLNVAEKEYVFCDDSGNSVYMPNKRLIIIGLENDLKLYLERKNGDKSEFLNESIAATSSSLLVVHSGPSFYRNQFAGGEVDALSKANAWRLVVKSERALKLSLQADFETEEERVMADAAVKIAMRSVRDYLSRVKATWPQFTVRESPRFPGVRQLAPQINETIDMTDKALEAVIVGSDKGELRVSVLIRTDDPIRIFAILLATLPRPAP